MDNQRNFIVAIALCLALLLGFDFVMGKLYPEPAPGEQVAAQPDTQVPRAAQHTREGGLTDPIERAEEARDLTTVLASRDRIAIDAPEVAGSINPVGARVDDIVLKTHRQTVARDSGPVRLFSPEGTPAQQFAQFGWVAPNDAGGSIALPGPQTVWQAEGGPLAPGKPVTLSWDNGQGQRFRIRFEIDEFYMLTARQTVVNSGTGQVALRPYAFVSRTSRTASSDTFNVHAGPIGEFGGAVNFDWDYDDVDEARVAEPEGRTGWVGYTDIYWLSALIPQEGARAEGAFRALGNETYRTDLIYDPVNLAPGTQATTNTRLFAGAKESKVLDHYEDGGVGNFGRAIDWGWFRWFMYPIFWLLRELFALTGNFGVAIILLTVIVRALMFPIAQKQFASMAQMRAVQPKMKALQDRHKDDKVTLQQEMAKLYKEEKVNPLAGCLPIFLQIPIFFALYKTLLVAIEMRHKPFALWIKDLSAQDPATILNLFGLLDFTPPSFLAIGVLAVLLGVTMWLQFKLNPAAMDPVQQQVFLIMPWVLMFVMAPFAAGLLLYWITSNVLTLAQQKYLYSKHPQLKAQAEKDAADKARAAERDKAPRVMSKSEDLIEEARRLFAGRVEFLLSAPSLDHLPEPEFLEIAFAGRSNVGKSSLINAVTGRKAIARASVTPGRTQELNFFEVGAPTRLRLVDMPGYGFAEAPVKVVERWRRLVRDFLRGRQVLRRTLVLIDSRHGIKPPDEEMLKMLDEAAVGYRLVLTKADKVKASELAATLAAVEAQARKHVAAYPVIHVTSAEKGMGIPELRAAILTDTLG